MERNALKGINLGGWLIVERWMTPRVFTGVLGGAEVDIARELGIEEARRRLAYHRDTFITEEDFKWIAAHGFDFVRLPVGYWLFGDAAGFVEGEGYLDKAFQWAQRCGLGVILDFHGLPGSQNGYDHSGQIGTVGLYGYDNLSLALKTLDYMAQKYGHATSLIGLEIINEPKITRRSVHLLGYYDRAYSTVAPYVRQEAKIIVSDAFQPLRIAKQLKKRSFDHRLVMDVHLYQLFSKQDTRLTYDEHIAKVSQQWKALFDDIRQILPILVGEWSAALPASMYQRSGKDEEAHAGLYYYAQRSLFDQYAWGHCYWTYKAPGCGVWSWRDIYQNLER